MEGAVTGGMKRVTVKVAAGVMAALTVLLQVGHVRAFWIPDFLELGECPSIKHHPNLNFERYSGIWFNIEMVPNEYAKIKSCAMTNFTWEGDLMLVEERGLNDDGIKTKQNSLMYPREGEPGVLTVEAENVPGDPPYVVMATDYETYSCVHSCLDKFGIRAAFSWVISRHPSLDPALVALCRERLQELGIDTSSMLPVTQGKECPYVNKLDAVLDYSARVQAKARAREVALHKLKPDTTAEDVQTVTVHRLQEENDGAKVEGVSVPKMKGDEDDMIMKMNDVMPNRRTHNTELPEPSGSDVTTPNTGLLMMLLLAVLMTLLTAPSSHT